MTTHDEWIDFLLNEIERHINEMKQAVDDIDLVRDSGRIQIILEFAGELRVAARTAQVHAEEIAQRAVMMHNDRVTK